MPKSLKHCLMGCKFFLIGCCLFACSENNLPQEHFKIESQKLQKVCPKRLDAETDLHTVQWSEPYFTYTFRLTHINTRTIDTLLFKNLLLPGIKTEICLRDDSVLCKKLGVIFCYRYLNSKSEYLCSIRQSYQTCNELPVKNAP